MQFLLDNILLIAIIAIAAGALLMPYINVHRYGPEVPPKTAVDLINHRRAVVVDVRPASEFRQGHIVRALNMPADKIQGRIEELPKDQPIILVDKTGGASRTVSRLLRGVGFDEVFIRQDGLASWRKEKMPLSS